MSNSKYNPPEQHKSSPHPRMEGHSDKDLGAVHGNNPHHNSVRSKDSYKSKGMSPNDALSITKAR